MPTEIPKICPEATKAVAVLRNLANRANQKLAQKLTQEADIHEKWDEFYHQANSTEHPSPDHQSTQP